MSEPDEYYENEHFTEWVSANEVDLQIEFLEKHADQCILDDDTVTFLEDHADEFNDYCIEQYDLADHEVYYEN